MLIIGSVASGKTTLAKRLSIENDIVYYEIDSIVHDDVNKIKRSSFEQDKIIKEINKQADWIIEGTLRKNLYYLLNYADKIIYLDVSVNIRKRRIFSRFLKQKIGIEKCNYKPTINMLKMMYAWNDEFEDNKDLFERKLEKYNKKIIKIESINKIKGNILNK